MSAASLFLWRMWPNVGLAAFPRKHELIGANLIRELIYFSFMSGASISRVVARRAFFLCYMRIKATKR